MSTLEHTLGPGPATSEGRQAAYRRVARLPGEDRLLRRELCSEPVTKASKSRRSLLHLAHVTDLQLADVASPGRFEFLEALRDLPNTKAFVPAQRPQEAMTPHVFVEMLRTIESAQSIESGAPVELIVSTGDAIDNAQWNELDAYLNLLAGGEVVLHPDGYAGVQRDDPSRLYWHPDGGADRWRELYGFPTLPGLLDAAALGFTAAGTAIPWISSFGNHEALPFGEVLPTPAYEAILTGSDKATALPPSLEPLGREEELFITPELFLSGPKRSVRADQNRRFIGRRDFVAAHLAASGSPAGHGFQPGNLLEETAYFAYDPVPEIRFLVLDTTNLDGASNGSIGARQLAWLEEELQACHSSFCSPSGEQVSGGGSDRLVVLASHHGLSSLSNTTERAIGLEPDRPRHGRQAVAALLERFPNVIAWLNGHRHLNEITAHRSKGRLRNGAQAGFFEISTASLADWPSQARLVEFVDNGDGTLSLLTTMLDHAAPPSVDDDLSLVEADRPGFLSSVHRELAGNVPQRGFGCGAEGTRLDRNCELLLSSPL